MQRQLLPLFPLGTVLFPRTPLPLHIFEDRYKEMISEAVRDNSEFGVVLLGEKGVANAGCTAVVKEVTHRYPDGKLDITTVGVRRFEIVSLNEGKDWLRGEITYFNDEETAVVQEDLRRRAISAYRELRELLCAESLPEPEWHDPQLSFQLAQLVTDLEFRQQLLMTRSEARRMRMLADFIPTHLESQRRIRHVRAVAPTNGHGPRRSDC